MRGSWVPRIPCLGTSHPVFGYLASRVWVPRIPCLGTSHPVSLFRFRLPLRLGKVAALAVGDTGPPVYGYKVVFWVNLPIGNRSAIFQVVQRIL